MTSPQQSSRVPLAIQELPSNNKTPDFSTTVEISPSPPTAAEKGSKGKAKEEAKEEKDLPQVSLAGVQKQLLNKLLEDFQRIASLTIAFVNSEMTSSFSPQERDPLDAMKHDIGMAQSAIEFVVHYDVTEYVKKEEAEAKLMETMMLIRVTVRSMREVSSRRGCTVQE